MSFAIATGEAPGHTCPDFLLEPAALGLAFWHREPWHQIALLEVNLTTFSDQQGVVGGLWEVLEQLSHLLWALQVILLRLKFEAIRVV